MECQKCKSRMNGNCCNDDEIVCETCGASYCLEYLGYYPEDSDDRIDEGFEEEQWKKEVEDIKNHNLMKRL